MTCCSESFAGRPNRTPRLRAASNPSFEQLEKEKVLLTEKAAKQAYPRRSFEEQLEPALEFLTNPWKLWESGDISLRRIVLKLAFADRIKCCRNHGARTPEIALPFKALGGFYGVELRYGGA